MLKSWVGDYRNILKSLSMIGLCLKEKKKKKTNPCVVVMNQSLGARIKS